MPETTIFDVIAAMLTPLIIAVATAFILAAIYHRLNLMTKRIRQLDEMILDTSEQRKPDSPTNLVTLLNMRSRSIKLQTDDLLDKASSLKTAVVLIETAQMLFIIAAILGIFTLLETNVLVPVIMAILILALVLLLIGSIMTLIEVNGSLGPAETDFLNVNQMLGFDIN